MVDSQRKAKSPSRTRRTPSSYDDTNVARARPFVAAAAAAAASWLLSMYRHIFWYFSTFESLQGRRTGAVRDGGFSEHS